MKVWAIVVIVLLLGACQTRGGFEQRLAAWKGRPVSEWVAKYGGPNWIRAAPNGEKLYAWQFSEGQRKDGPVTKPVGRPRPHSACTVTLAVADGLIRDATFEGDACLASAP
jgi:hypothetical protein